MQPSATESDYMSLAPGVGVIPPKYRNAGYKKLGAQPGTLGLGDSDPAAKADSGSMQAFLAGIASGADPKEFATQLLATNATGRSRGRKGAVA